MSDFTFQIFQQCTSSLIITSRNGKYTITGIGREGIYPSCTCPAYKYRKHGTTNFGGKTVPSPCKHIEEAAEDSCLWHEMFSSEVQTEYQKENMICPVCGGRTEYVKVAV